jgi:hypothetical protein
LHYFGCFKYLSSQSGFLLSLCWSIWRFPWASLSFTGVIYMSFHGLSHHLILEFNNEKWTHLLHKRSRQLVCTTNLYICKYVIYSPFQAFPKYNIWNWS